MTDAEDRIAVLVHEVRSPVAALSAIAETFPETDSAGRKELARLTIAACSAVERLVTDITVASVRPALVDVGALVRDAATARQLVGDSVLVDLDVSLPAVQGDSVRLRQALDNLLANAAAHAEGSGTTRVRARSTQAAVAVSVSDSGPGIAPDDLDRIFEPGVRLVETRQGTGLGLAITRAIVHAHGGTLGVESEPGRGSTFTITLPRGDRGQPDT